MYKYPEWFKFETGFRFLDDGKCECVFLGEAGFRKEEPMGHLSLHKTKGLEARSVTLSELKFMPMDSWVFVFKYKKEWHFADLKRSSDYNQEWWDKISPWTPDAEVSP